MGTTGKASKWVQLTNVSGRPRLVSRFGWRRGEATELLRNSYGYHTDILRYGTLSPPNFRPDTTLARRAIPVCCSQPPIPPGSTAPPTHRLATPAFQVDHAGALSEGVSRHNHRRAAIPARSNVRWMRWLGDGRGFLRTGMSRAPTWWQCRVAPVCRCARVSCSCVTADRTYSGSSGRRFVAVLREHRAAPSGWRWGVLPGCPGHAIS